MIKYLLIIKDIKIKDKYMIEEINICICFDENYFKFGIKLIKSILNTTKYNKNLIYFYILVDNGEKNKLFNELIKLNINFYIKEFNPDKELLELIFTQKNYEINNKKLINNIYYNFLNYARFYFKDYFPELNKIIFLDADIELLEGIENLYFEPFLQNYYIAAFTNGINFKKKYNNKNRHNILPEFKYYSKRNKNNTMTFNAGVFITLLDQWKENNIKNKLINWIKINNNLEYPIFIGGTQAPLNMVFCDNYEKLNNKIFYHYKGKK